MTSLRRNNTANSFVSTTAKTSKFTHCVVQYQDFDETKKIVEKDKILNPSNRRLKAGDDCTIKNEGRNHIRAKILFCGMLHSFDIIWYQ